MPENELVVFFIIEPCFLSFCKSPDQLGNTRLMISHFYGIQMTHQRQNFKMMSEKFNQNIATLLITQAMITSSKNALHAAQA